MPLASRAAHVRGIRGVTMMRRALGIGGGLRRVWRWIGAAHVLVRVVGLVAVLCLLLALLARATAPHERGAERSLGKPLPAAALPAVRDGRLLAPQVLAAEAGHPRLLLFTYSLCAHCPPVVRTVQRLAGEPGASQPHALYVDSPAEGPAIAQAYAQRLSLDAPLYLDAHGALAARLGIAAYPALVLLDERSVVRGVWIGETSEAALRAALGALEGRGARRGPCEAISL